MGLFTYGKCIYCKGYIWFFQKWYLEDPNRPETMAHDGCIKQVKTGE